MPFVKSISIEKLQQKNGQTIVKVGNRQLALVTGPSGDIFAIDNRCPHEGYPLSEGTVGEDCVLTCNWHNWKFRLDTGECILGGDNVRVYPLEIRQGSIWVDPSGPPHEILVENLLKGFRKAFERRQYGRLARELARFHFSDIDLKIPLNTAVIFTAPRLEFGMGHAFAALADWLYLANLHPDDTVHRIACLTEAIDHLALDVLRQPEFPFVEGSLAWDEALFLAAVERENEQQAMTLLNGALEEKVEPSEIQRVFSKAALAHYNDFGHSLIYVQKAFHLERHLSNEAFAGVLRALLRGLCGASREDLLPEFKAYASQLAAFKSANGQTKEPTTSPGRGVKAALNWVVENAGSQAESLYDTLLMKNAENMLFFDETLHWAADNPVSKNVSWLSFTHALTFSQAVRSTTSRWPELWPEGLLQMACFLGRNGSYLDLTTDIEQWMVQDPQEFMSKALNGLTDHGQGPPIFSAHLLKTTLAVRAELATCTPETANVLRMSLNRFLRSPIKQKHVRRLVSQGIRLVERDYKD